MKTRKVKTPRQKLVKKLDKLSKDIVRQRDGNICQYCGQWCEGSNRHVSHVIPVSAGSKLRWDPLNMKILDYHHHINWWHKNPMESSAWFADKFPDRWVYLQTNRGIKKFTIAELEELVKNLEEQLN